jgi:hypothetical protein
MAPYRTFKFTGCKFSGIIMSRGTQKTTIAHIQHKSGSVEGLSVDKPIAKYRVCQIF